MRVPTLAAALAGAALMPIVAAAAPVSLMSMTVTGTVTGVDFFRPIIDAGPPTYSASFSRDPNLPHSYYGLSPEGFFTTEIGGAVDGIITLFEDSETSEQSLSCAFAQYSYDTCAGASWASATTDADGNMLWFAADGGSETRITSDGTTASMIYQDDRSYGGTTTDGRSWYSHGLTVTWDLTVGSMSDEREEDVDTPLVSTPLPSSALLLLTPLAALGLRRRRKRSL